MFHLIKIQICLSKYTLHLIKIQEFLSKYTSPQCILAGIYTLYNFHNQEEMSYFNNTLNIYYLRVYGFGHIVKDHLRWWEKKSTATTWVTLSKGSFICTIPDTIAHTMTFVISVVEQWLEQEIAQWVHHEVSIWRPIAPWATLTYHGVTSRSFQKHLLNVTCTFFYVIKNQTSHYFTVGDIKLNYNQFDEGVI